MSATCTKLFSLRVRPDLFGGIAWTFASAITPPSSGSAAGTGRNPQLSIAIPTGTYGGFAGSATVSSKANPVTITNTSGSIQNCVCTVDVTILNDAGIQHGSDYIYIYRIDGGGTLYRNTTGPIANGSYVTNFPIPMGVSTWDLEFNLAGGPGFTNINGTITWDITFEVL